MICYNVFNLRSIFLFSNLIQYEPHSNDNIIIMIVVTKMILTIMIIEIFLMILIIMLFI